MKKLKLSHSSVTTYNECGLKYKLHYLDRLRPKKQRSALLFGNALDKGLNKLLLTKDIAKAKEEFYKYWCKNLINNVWEELQTSENVIYSKNDTDEELLNYYNDKHPNKPWSSLYQKGLLMMEAFNEEILPRIKEVITVQKKISIKNSCGDKIEGFLDLIIKWEDDKIYLMDNKSSSVKYSPDSAEKSQQLGLYYYVEKDTYNLQGVGYFVMSKNINKNRCKICKVCNYMGEGSHKKCDNLIKEKRCNGEWDITIHPTCDTQIILNEIKNENEDNLLEPFDKANHGISNGQFEANKSACYGIYGKCQFYELCHKNDDSELIKVGKGKKR